MKRHIGAISQNEKEELIDQKSKCADENEFLESLSKVPCTRDGCGKPFT